MWEPKLRGIILELEQVREELSAVTKQTPDPEAEGEAGNIETGTGVYKESSR